MSFIIKIGDRHIGPFPTREPAEKEAGERFAGESWTIIEVEPQLDALATPDERDRAWHLHGSDDIEIDDNALASRADGEHGVWVQGWLWVPDEEHEDEDEDEDNNKDDKDEDEDIDDEDDEEARMTKTQFVRENKETIDGVIRSAGISGAINNTQRWDWVMNEEFLYNMAVKAGVSE